jgi:hypothetical protein
LCVAPPLATQDSNPFGGPKTSDATNACRAVSGRRNASCKFPRDLVAPGAEVNTVGLDTLALKSRCSKSRGAAMATGGTMTTSGGEVRRSNGGGPLVGGVGRGCDCACACASSNSSRSFSCQPGVAAGEVSESVVEFSSAFCARRCASQFAIPLATRMAMTTHGLSNNPAMNGG